MSLVLRDNHGKCGAARPPCSNPCSGRLTPKLGMVKWQLAFDCVEYGVPVTTYQSFSLLSKQILRDFRFILTLEEQDGKRTVKALPETLSYAAILGSSVLVELVRQRVQTVRESGGQRPIHLYVLPSQSQPPSACTKLTKNV